MAQTKRRARVWVVSWILLTSIAAAAGCGDDIPTESEAAVDAGASGGDASGLGDVGAGEDGGQDAEDAGSGDAGVDTAGEGDAGQDGGGQDAGPICPGGAGCACASASDCYSDQCVEVAGEKVCAALCGAGCSEASKCVKVKGQGSAIAEICVPRWAGLCDPCMDNASCQGLGGEDNACVPRGDAGAFCATACATGADCPKGYACEQTQDVDGVSVKQCVLPAGEVCACSSGAMKQELVTSCRVAHPGGTKCLGQRKCLPDGAPTAPEGGGLTACDAPAPATEVCDALDNDCDGATDESTCDDADNCTVDACKGSAGCAHQPDSGAACDADGSVCTVGDTCKDGVCAPGPALPCDDKNPCTVDLCDPKAGCKSTPDSGGACDADDNPCTTNDVCKVGVCQPGPVKACDSGDPCIAGKCHIGDGKCVYTDKIKTPCNDGNLCTVGEVCDKQSCTGKAVVCDDQNACTTDSCDPKQGCKNAATPSGVCDDGDKCTAGDTCQGGKCLGLPLEVTKVCDDGNPCTKGVCKDGAKGCEYEPLDAVACDDGNGCTDNDVCTKGTCESGQNTCACTADVDCAAKEDGNPCNGTLYCDKVKPPFQCKIKPGSVVQCDAKLNGDCQTNACNPKSGVCEVIQEQDGSACDADGSVCSEKDACKSGKCVAGKQADCDDGNGCTDDACDPKVGCTHKPNTNPCDADGSDCTVGDACVAGTCVAGKKKSCDDGEACTDDVCVAEGGKCLHKHVTKGCDDDNKCTLQDQCGLDAASGLYTCVSSDALACNDKNPCTDDKCDPKAGCKFIAVPDGGQCDDGDACTAADVCAAGTCKGKALDAKVECDDGNPCTDDVCQVDKGCAHKPTVGKACDDGNACTDKDYCKSGQCLPGLNTCPCTTNADCAKQEDGDACNGTLFCDKSAPPFRCKVDPGTVVTCDTSVNTGCQSNVCDPKVGKCAIVKAADKQPCNADDNVCTAGDACSNGICTAGGLLPCDDKNLCTADSCDPKAGCLHKAVAGACDDGDACTSADACSGGACKGKSVDEKIKCDDGNACTLDGCDIKKGCVYTALTGKKCDDGNACTVGEGCVKGKCEGGENVCACAQDADCAAKDDGNLCNGVLFCDKGAKPFRCRIKPNSVVSCDTSADNFCLKTYCIPKTGKCYGDVKGDGTPCDADGSLCTTKDVCKSAKCVAGAALPCDDLNPCTADSCSPAKGCEHTAQAGGCDADGDACTGPDLCKSSKCEPGKQKSCDDGEMCTADACDKGSGACIHKPLVQSCSDDNLCTAGDVCGMDAASKKYTCLSGKVLKCDDANPCTVDGCDKDKGCLNTVNTDLSVPCWSGDPSNRGKGVCADGVQKCKADGALDKCVGSKLPSAELCDGVDNNCDGFTDEGCAPTAFSARMGTALIRGGGSGAKYGARVLAGGSGAVGRPKPAGKYAVHFGFYAWLRAMVSKK